MSIWIDLGRALSKFMFNYKQEHEDYELVGNTLREAAIFLYIQWYILSRERYEKLAQEAQMSESAQSQFV